MTKGKTTMLMCPLEFYLCCFNVPRSYAEQSHLHPLFRLYHWPWNYLLPHRQIPGSGKMQICVPADRPTGEMRTKPVDQVCSLPVGQFAGPHYYISPIQIHMHCFRDISKNVFHRMSFNVTKEYLIFFDPPFCKSKNF